eukprot:1090838_1
MSSQWRCLKCTFLSEETISQCLKCGNPKANTAIRNMNQMCLCGQKVIEYPYGFDQCDCCCKVMEEEEKGYYFCNATECTWRQMTGEYFMVCSACYESMNSSSIDSKYSILFCKVASMMERIKNET